MKIIDSFIFFNELDLLEIRLNILYDFVDYFVITEADTTFSGNPKKMYYLENKERFKRFESKIVYNQISIPSDLVVTWDREIYQRNSSLSVLKSKFSGDDLILTSDLDEIPEPKVLQHNYDWFEVNKLFHFKQKMFVYYLNNFKNDNWFGTRACSLSLLNEKSIDDIRQATEDEKLLSGFIIEGAGWHFTCLGGAETIKHKLESFSHQEHNTELIKMNIASNLERNTDFLGRPYKYKSVDLDGTFPDYIVNNYHLYPHLIKNVSN